MGFNNILITGAAGFIGHHLGLRLAKDGFNVTGIDNLNTYYDVLLKRARLFEAGISLAGRPDTVVSTRFDRLSFRRVDLNDERALEALFREGKFDAVIHLAAQSGIRYNGKNAKEYIETNNSAFLNLLEVCRQFPVQHLIFASSGLVYGIDTKMPFSGPPKSDHPLSLYTSVKRWNELISHTYSNLYDIPVSGIRLFSVYGPWGRPDTACISFARSIQSGEPIDVVDTPTGGHSFTYVDDVVETIVRLIPKVPVISEELFDRISEPRKPPARYRLIDVGCDKLVDMNAFIASIEAGLGSGAVRRPVTLQNGKGVGVPPDLMKARNLLGYTPDTGFGKGIESFMKWYHTYYG